MPDFQGGKIVPESPILLTKKILGDGLLQVFVFLINSFCLLCIYAISVITEIFLAGLIFGSMDAELIESHPMAKEFYFWLQMSAAAIGIISYLIHLLIGAVALAKIEIKSVKDE